MRQLKVIWLLSVGVPVALSCDIFTPKTAFAQTEARIVYPQEGQDVRGEITARFEGIPAGGYAKVQIDGQFRQASAQDFVVLDTLSDRVTFARGDGAYKMDIIIFNAGGKRVGTTSVTFNVANNKVDATGASVRLVHWTAKDRSYDGVQRFRVFAEANATISGGETEGGGAMGGGAMGGGGGGGGSSEPAEIPAPLDFQVSALMRRLLRDTNMLNGSANIATSVQEGFERQREGAGAAGGMGGDEPASTRGKKSAKKVVGKAPWAADWSASPEVGKFFVKRIQQNGTEINATRKAPSIAIADLLPTFPDAPVRPGSTWGTTMSFVGDLSTRTPINVKDAPMTFTSYEDFQTPSGESRRCAKLESRFRLPDNLAKRIAANLANKVGGAGGAGGAGAGAGAGAGGGGGGGGASAIASGDSTGEAVENALTEDDIVVARTDVARVIWFDVERRRILRAEDTLVSNFEVPTVEAGAGAGSTVSTGEGAGAAPTKPVAVAYNLTVTTWLDDRVPNPTGQYLPGGAGAHTRDSVAEPGLSRILRGNSAPLSP